MEKSNEWTVCLRMYINKSSLSGTADTYKKLQETRDYYQKLI